jgi:hypothetical protein
LDLSTPISAPNRFEVRSLCSDPGDRPPEVVHTQKDTNEPRENAAAKEWSHGTPLFLQLKCLFFHKKENSGTWRCTTYISSEVMIVPASGFNMYVVKEGPVVFALV